MAEPLKGGVKWQQSSPCLLCGRVGLVCFERTVCVSTSAYQVEWCLGGWGCWGGWVKGIMGEIERIGKTGPCGWQEGQTNVLFSSDCAQDP